MGLFRKKKPADEDQLDEQELTPEQLALSQLDELQKTTEQIEAEKEAKRLAREEKKFLKEVEKRRKQKERFIAPLILLITIVVSWIVWTIYR